MSEKLLSEKNPYYISRHRYYELKHWCLQYIDWMTEVMNLSGYSAVCTSVLKPDWDVKTLADPTGDYAVKLARYSNNMETIERLCRDVDLDMSDYLFANVTRGIPYEVLQTKYDIPYSRDTFYDRRRKFFYELDKVRT